MIVNELNHETQEMRAAFCDRLIELAQTHPNLVVMDADLMGAMGTKPFAARYPERTVDCGIQEANMVGVAVGLSLEGKIPFAHTFGPFMSRRATDQIFISGAYSKANVKLIGSDPGITAKTNGGTHMPFEDMGIMRSIPEMTIIEPTDITMLKYVMGWMADHYGMQYMRLVRKECYKIYEDDTEFEIGKAVTVRDDADADVTIIASGFCVAQSIKAAQELERQGIRTRILDMFTWKPIDEEAIVHGFERLRVPGRMELYPSASGAIVGVVDYAHNGMSLQTMLCDLRENYPDRELAVVFGATGGKGVDRRETMGEAAGKYADRIVITEDDPGPEDPADICRAIAGAIEAQGNHNWQIVLDRPEAILTCVRETTRPAVVIVSGKSHETRQLRADGPEPCEADGVLLERALKVWGQAPNFH